MGGTSYSSIAYDSRTSVRTVYSTTNKVSAEQRQSIYRWNRPDGDSRSN
jgi:hypothetical protein